MGLDLDMREESIFATLDGAWTPVSALVTALAGGRAWRRPDGRPITGRSLGEVMRRCAAKLVARGFVESKTVPGLRGPTLQIRRSFDGNSATATRRSQQNARSARQMGISEPSERVASQSKKESPRNLVHPTPYGAEVFAISPRRYPPAKATPEYHGYTSLPIELRVLAHGVPMPVLVEVTSPKEVAA